MLGRCWAPAHDDGQCLTARIGRGRLLTATVIGKSARPAAVVLRFMTRLISAASAPGKQGLGLALWGQAVAPCASPAPTPCTCPPRGSACVWDPGASIARPGRAAVRSSELLSGVLLACSWGLGRALLQCHRSADTCLEWYRLPAMFVGHAGPCSMDPCQCSALLAGSRGRETPPGCVFRPTGLVRS